MSATLSRQIAALGVLIAIMDGRKPRPKPQQMQMLMDDAKAGLSTLRKVDAMEAGVKLARGIDR